MDSMSTPRRLPLLRGDISYEEALERDDNVLLQLSHRNKVIEFFEYLYKNRNDIKNIVSHHLRLEKVGAIRLGDFSEWQRGSFNVCIPVYVGSDPSPRVIVRFPQPYKVGEAENSGNADEKVRCEVATICWMRMHCADIPIPSLRGFGFSDGLDFTPVENTGYLARFWYLVKRMLSFFTPARVPVPFVRRNCLRDIKTAYVLMDFITDSKTLSENWANLSQDQMQRKNLIRDLSRIMLSLNRKHSSCIGSLTIDDDAMISVTNRPLSTVIPELENDRCPRIMGRKQTYTAADSYYNDLLLYHDTGILYKANAITSEVDGYAQAGALTMMRAALPNFVDRDLRHGPFVLQLDDLHQGNIFIDESGHVRWLVDFEWASFRPIQMQRPPLWLTGKGVDQFEDGELETYQTAYQEFVSIFEEEERILLPTKIPLGPHGLISRADLMRRNWDTSSLWYLLALDCPSALFNLLTQHIEPKFAKIKGHSASPLTLFWNFARFWRFDVSGIVQDRITDREIYEKELREIFTREET